MSLRVIRANDEGVHSLLCGDFNGDMGCEGGLRGVKEPTKAKKVVLEFMREHSCHAANLMNNAHGSIDTFSCHNGASVNDYMMIPDLYKERVVSCHVDDEHPLNIERFPGFV